MKRRREDLRGVYLDGLTDGEQLAFNNLVGAWNVFARLEDVHPSDRNEFLFAIHAAQNIVLARCALRRAASAEDATDELPTL